MGPAWDRHDPGGPHVGHVNLAIWVEQVVSDGIEAKNGVNFDFTLNLTLKVKINHSLKQ